MKLNYSKTIISIHLIECMLCINFVVTTLKDLCVHRGIEYFNLKTFFAVQIYS